MRLWTLCLLPDRHPVGSALNTAGALQLSPWCCVLSSLFSSPPPEEAFSRPVGSVPPVTLLGPVARPISSRTLAFSWTRLLPTCLLNFYPVPGPQLLPGRLLGPQPGSVCVSCTPSGVSWALLSTPRPVHLSLSPGSSCSEVALGGGAVFWLVSSACMLQGTWLPRGGPRAHGRHGGRGQAVLLPPPRLPLIMCWRFQLCLSTGSFRRASTKAPPQEN